MNLSDLITSFISAREADRRSSATLRWYCWQLGAFLSSVGDLDLDQVTATVIRAYVNGLRREETHYSGGMVADGPVSDETVTGRLRALRALFKWAVREEVIETRANPMRNIHVPQIKPGEIKAANMDNWCKLLAACTDDEIGCRNRAILAFLLDTGCRAGGLVGLKPDDLNMDFETDSYFAIVTEKGNKTRPVPFVRYTAHLLTQWLTVRPADAEYVFCSYDKKGNFLGPLTVTGLSQVLRRLKKKAGVTGRVNPHSFRHAFAREVATASGDIALVRRLMGHDQIDTTDRYYARYTYQEDARAHKEVSPLRNELSNEKDGTNVQ